MGFLENPHSCPWGRNWAEPVEVGPEIVGFAVGSINPTIYPLSTHPSASLPASQPATHPSTPPAIIHPPSSSIPPSVSLPSVTHPSSHRQPQQPPQGTHQGLANRDSCLKCQSRDPCQGRRGSLHAICTPWAPRCCRWAALTACIFFQPNRMCPWVVDS